jgi:hypothetical protein
MISRKLTRALALAGAGLLGTIAVVSQAEVDIEMRGNNERTTVKSVSAVITAIDAKTREVTIEGSLGNFITLTAGPELTRFDELAVGDMVNATYTSSLSGELREPTEEELANPLVVLDAEAIKAQKDEDPGAAVGVTVRAVCTIEGMNRVTGTVMLKDSDGDFHLIEDVDPAKMAGVNIGQTVVVTYTEAFALSLDKQHSTK